MDTNYKADYEFLRAFPPFDLLNTDEFKLLFTKSQLTFIEEGESLFEQGKSLKSDFFVIKKGTVKLYADQQLIDECDTGDIIGMRPHLGGGMYLSTAKAVQDTLVYQFSVARFKEILEQNAQVALFFAAGFASGISQAGTSREDQSANTRKYLNVQQESDNKSFGVYTDTIELNPSRNILTCLPTDTIQEAARRMTAQNVGSLVIADAKGYPIGILTDTDFRRKVVSVSENIKSKAVSEIMSSPVVCVNDGQSVAEAMLAMLRKNISHLCVTEDGTPDSPLVGVLSQRDLIVQQGNSPAALVKQMQHTSSVEKLAKLRDRAETLITSYLEHKVSIPFISGVITEINDLLIKKAEKFTLATLKEEGITPPEGLRYCWMSLGSEGREEQLLRTDQDNAMVFQVADSANLKEAKNFCLRLSEGVRDVLIACGFVPCPADMMASNPRWCNSLEDWKKTFSGWIHTPDMDALLQSNIFFDFRPVLGDAELTLQLRDFIQAEIAKQKTFLGHLAKNALKNPPPLSFFKGFIVEKSGEHKNDFDIKARSMMPLTDAARVLSYQLNIRGTYSTFGRFEAIAERDENLSGVCKSAAMAYEILLRLRATQGLKNGDSGRFIKPESLNKLERQILRNTFKTIDLIQKLFETRFQLAYFQ